MLKTVVPTKEKNPADMLPSVVEAEKFSYHPRTLWLRVFILAIVNTGEAEASYATLKFYFHFGM
jgi:hypothetical protein